MRFTSKLLRFAHTPKVSLGRIRHIVEQSRAGSGSWAIVSPMRGDWDETLGVPRQTDSPEFTDRTNSLMAEEIKKDIRRMGLGYRKCEGVGQEEGGAQNRETSFFIPKITLAQAEELWHKYHQWGIVYGGPEFGGQVTLLGPDGEATYLGSLSLSKSDEDQYWTEHSGQPFVFK